MDAPGVLPMRIQDQAAATRLAICNDIGEASYAVAGVASVLVEMLKRIPTAGAYNLKMIRKLLGLGNTERHRFFLEHFILKYFSQLLENL